MRKKQQELSMPDLFKLEEVKLVYRNKTRPEDRIKLPSNIAVYDVLMSVWDMNKIDMVEQAMMLMLDRGQHCLGASLIATGSVGSCLIDPKIVFATAIKANASGIVIAHNHPSGSLNPSSQDIAMTKKLIEGGNLLDILILDHMIVTRHGFNSYGENGWRPKPHTGAALPISTHL